ncbi:MAG: NFACT RNA binding domain-containing protein [Faecalimonas umbilicata]|uniref:Rqc2 family fibronectin-binding protein n=1 Tax=Faecalimonas umbilicata TaxID=1912855 RepID=UPI002A759D8D|nr:NFACT RNA binding domain-containing protein [Faecalimonas umbilicata]MDY2761233.1 NFACT RNA binding domain-containing protein [Faecalimonas umbilicata]
MAFDGITIANIVHELNRNLLDGRINKIAQPETDELLLTIKTPGGQRRLSISASASLPLIYLTEGNKPSPMTAPNFCMLLRKHINNGRITKIWQPKLERIIHFEIEHLDELGDLCKKELIVEIMGKHSNIIFCNEDGMIIDSIKHVSSQMSSVREVLPGRTYFIPDTMEKSDPLSVSFAEFQRVLTEKPMPLAKAVYTSFTGISPVVAEEICYLSGIDSALTPRELSEDLLTHLYRQFTLYFEEVTAGHFSPAIYYHGAEPKEFSALPLTHFSQYIRKEYDSISRLLEDYYAEKNTLTRIRQKSVDLRRVVQTALERNRKKYDLQAKQLRDTENREKFKVYGELIHTYGYNLEPGAKKLEALNYYTNEMITIPLDSTKMPQENALKYFEKYNKQKRTFEALTSLIEETRDDISYLESVSNALDIALSEDDLTQIKEELIESGYIRRKFTKKKVKITSKPFHYLSSDGYHIYVGKNNLQNEELTFHFASGNDWWFHAKGIPGSHVIVKTNGEELPDRTFEEAGKLAAYYSKNRGSEKIEIDYIEKKHVKKPKGGKPGFVVYYTNYSLMIDSDISQIKQLED